MRPVLGAALALCAVALFFPGGALAATSAGQPFPSNLYTSSDKTQVTELRVDLPKPDCTTHPSDCADIAVLNTLDGFNIQPRISVPFSGPIDLSTVSSSTIFLVGPGDHVVGINQVEWEPAANTLHFESDQQLAQDALTCSSSRPASTTLAGQPLAPLRPATRRPARTTMRSQYGLRLGGAARRAVGWRWQRAPTAHLRDRRPERLHDAEHRRDVGEDPQRSCTRGRRASRSARTASARSSRSSIVDPAPPAERNRHVQRLVPAGIAALHLPGSVGTVAFGSYASPDYENADEVIPAAGTKVGVPAVQSVNQLGFTLFMPSGRRPAAVGPWRSSATGSPTRRTARRGW